MVFRVLIKIYCVKNLDFKSLYLKLGCKTCLGFRISDLGLR